MKMFAENLKKLRKEWKMTQADLANRSGISIRSIQNYEQDRDGRSPTFYNVMLLADFFNVNPYYLYYGEEKEMKANRVYMNELISELKQLSFNELKEIHDSSLTGVSLPKLSVSPEVIDDIKDKFNKGVHLPERGILRPYIEQTLVRYAQNRQEWKKKFNIK